MLNINIKSAYVVRVKPKTLYIDLAKEMINLKAVNIYTNACCSQKQSKYFANSFTLMCEQTFFNL